MAEISNLVTKFLIISFFAMAIYKCIDVIREADGKSSIKDSFKKLFKKAAKSEEKTDSIEDKASSVGELTEEDKLKEELIALNNKVKNEISSGSQEQQEHHFRIK